MRVGTSHFRETWCVSSAQIECHSVTVEVTGAKPVRTAYGSLICLKSALDDYTEVPSVSFNARVGSKHFETIWISFE